MVWFYSEHADYMFKNGVWGTEVEIFAMATILNTSICVYSKYGNAYRWLEYKPLDSCSEDNSRECIMISNVSHHFEPVFP